MDIASLVAMSAVRQQLADIVRDELPVLADVATKKTTYPRTQPRGYVETPSCPKPAGNYTEAMMASVRWRSGKGECISSGWMAHPDGKKALIEQYGDQCSILVRDPAHRPAKWSGWKLIEAGTSPWIGFHVLDGSKTAVQERMSKKGWGVPA